MKKKQIKVVGKEIDILRKVRSNGHKLRTSLKHAPDIVEKNIYQQENSKKSVLIVYSKFKEQMDLTHTHLKQNEHKTKI